MSFGLASSAFARHYLRNLGCCLFLALLRCFSSGRSPRTPMYSMHVDAVLPHRVAPFGYLRIITPICGSPKLFAACRVLHRLLMPRHSPCALLSFTYSAIAVELCRLNRFLTKLYTLKSLPFVCSALSCAPLLPCFVFSSVQFSRYM